MSIFTFFHYFLKLLTHPRPEDNNQDLKKSTKSTRSSSTIMQTLLHLSDDNTVPPNWNFSPGEAKQGQQHNRVAVAFPLLCHMTQSRHQGRNANKVRYLCLLQKSALEIELKCFSGLKNLKY